MEESQVGGVPATIITPGWGSGPWPVALIVPGVTRLGRRHPALVALGRGLAAVGHLTVVADPEGLAVGELTPAVVHQTRAAAIAAARRPEATGRVVLVGVSGGATIALLVAADPQLAGRVSAVAVLAPCCDIGEAMRVITTGAYRDGRALVPFSSGDLFKLVIARSIVAWLPDGADKSTLRAHLLSLHEYGPEPLAGLRGWPQKTLGAAARSAVELLSNVDPARFDELFAALPEGLRRSVDEMSPLAAAHRIPAPVELVVAREDKYIPLADARRFARTCPHARLTVIESLRHAVPRVSPKEARDLARLDAVLVRLLAAAYSGR
jgi:pimeloyl-ACP methyl ester carboxylesterase